MTRPTTRDRLDGAPSFVMVGGGELQLQRGLSWLARVLLLELIAIADHVSGRGRTSYAALAIVCAVDPPARGPRPDQATKDRLRSAFAELHGRGLVTLDRIKNEKQQALFFRVSTRVGLSASERNSPRNSPRFVDARKVETKSRSAINKKPLSRGETAWARELEEAGAALDDVWDIHKTPHGSGQVFQEEQSLSSEALLRKPAARVGKSVDKSSVPAHVAPVLDELRGRLASARRR